MRQKIRQLIRDRGVWGLYLINFLFQTVFRITSQKVRLLHFTNVVSADSRFVLEGEGEFAERCLRINGGIVIQASNGVFLDRSVLIGPGAKIISGNHDLDDFSKPSVEGSPIRIGPHCWIGANAIVLSGVVLKTGTIVGAGSVVTRSIDAENVVIAGSPARIVRQRI